MAQGNREVVDFLIQMAEDPAKVEDFKINPNKVLSTFDFPDDIKSDIVSGKLENIYRHIKHPPGKTPPPPAYSLDPDFQKY
jgi:hypothetical protein